MEIADIRRDYSLKELSKSSVAPDPIAQFSVWMREALDAALIEPTAMTVSTVGADGKPSSRVVLLKGFDADGFVFFTNYESRKGSDLAANPHTSLHFFWPELERQVIISGVADKVSRERSEAYFASRPVGSRIGAWASKQSSILTNREELERRVEEIREKFPNGDVPCPPFWGGFRVKPTRVEFWQGRKSRLHDRIVYESIDEAWSVVRLSP
jgi:pyridoxamine 5'-phosphate oxidase